MTGTLTRVQDLIDRLTHFGLRRDESSAYIHLLMEGPSKASELAHATRLDRSQAYHVLDHLAARGFVTKRLTSPFLYEANPPDETIEGLVAHTRERLTQMERAQLEVVSALRGVHARPGQNLTKSAFRVVEGREGYYRLTMQMMRRAQKEVWIASTLPGGVERAEVGGLTEVARERAKEGVEFLVIVQASSTERAALGRLFGDVPGIQIRHIEHEIPMRFVIVDGKELQLGAVLDPSTKAWARGDVTMWTDARDLVLGQGVLFEELWARAEPVHPAPLTRSESAVRATR